MDAAEINEIVARIRAGSAPAIARGLTVVEAGGAAAEALTEALYPFSGTAHVVGITGAAGVGKSTLVRALGRAVRSRGTSLAVLAVDPSSPFSGGAILGDRIRMTDFVADPGVFVRSMATRGAQGGLARGVSDSVDLLAAAGKQLVIVETVGVGQGEVDIMRLAHTTVVVSVPGLGDDVQALKAGLLEIADIHVVNKADREGADRTVEQLKSMMMLGESPPGAWEPPVISCVATQEQGAAQLLDAVDGHWDFLRTTGTLMAQERRIAQARVLSLAQTEVARQFEQQIDEGAAGIDDALTRVATQSAVMFTIRRVMNRMERR